MMGERYVEPQGSCTITNKSTGDISTIEFKARTGWTPKPEDIRFVSASIRNAAGKEIYRLEGKYHENIKLINVSTGF